MYIIRNVDVGANRCCFYTDSVELRRPEQLYVCVCCCLSFSGFLLILLSNKLKTKQVKTSTGHLHLITVSLH